LRPKPNAQPNKSLIDGIATLQALATSSEPIGGRELARQLNLEATRVNRLLKTLAYLGIARQTADRKYTSGPGMHVLAAQSLFASGLISRSLPELESLRHFGHTVAMGVLWRDSVSYLYHSLPNMPAMQALGRIGLYPASQGGIGIVLLAELTDSQIRERYMDKDIPRHPNGVESLIKEIQTTRKQGYARVRVHADKEHHTIAVVVGQPVHSAIAVHGWIPAAATKTIVNALRTAASAIETSQNSRNNEVIELSSSNLAGLNAV